MLRLTACLKCDDFNCDRRSRVVPDAGNFEEMRRAFDLFGLVLDLDEIEPQPLYDLEYHGDYSCEESGLTLEELRNALSELGREDAMEQVNGLGPSKDFFEESHFSYLSVHWRPCPSFAKPELR